MPSNTTRIAKNTLMLYFRQIVIMLVSLYTVRVVLEILGVEDFGIYNVVGGVVILFTFLNTALTHATQRFLNFALGRSDTEQVRNIYSVSLVIHTLVAVLFVVLAQTIGLWIFHTWLNIPYERQTAAFVVYQISVVTAVIGVLQIPYRATIIAYEKMSFFAIIGVIDAVLRLSVVFLLQVIQFDQLLVYVFFVCITGIIILLIHKMYCNITFETARFRYCNDKRLFKHLLGFSGWSIFGGMANIGRDYGANILMNIFHGVKVNAAMGIAMQVNFAVYYFVSNFQTAFNPQIVKSYSVNDYAYFMQLIFRTAKVSFCLLFFFVLPLYINANFVLQIWLDNVPEYSVRFTQLILLFSLIETILSPLRMSIQATGDIKRYQLIVSCFIFANLPLSLFFLWLGFSPVTVLFIRVVLNGITLVWHMFFLRGRIKFPVFDFFREVIVPMFMIVGISGFVTVYTRNLFVTDWNRLISSCVISSISIGFLMYRIGLNKQERFLLRNWLKVKTIKRNEYL